MNSDESFLCHVNSDSLTDVTVAYIILLFSWMQVKWEEFSTAVRKTKGLHKQKACTNP